MKKFIYILIVALLSMTALAIEPTITAPKINADDWSGSVGRDRAWRWAIAMENAVESMGDPPLGTGTNFYVDSGVSNAGDGSSWDNAVATVEEAIALCANNAGDVIYVAQGHTESWTAAAGAALGGFDADIAGISIVGMGQGDDRPTFTFADTDATCAVGAASVRFENLVFLAGISEVVAGVIVEATGVNFTMYDCEFPEPLVSSYEFNIGIQLTAAANDVTIAYCIAYSGDATGADHWINGGAGVVESLTIVNNVVYGEYAIAPIFSDQADLKTRVAGNLVGNMTTGEKGIEFSGNATGWCYDNLVVTDTVAESYDTGVMDGGGGLWADEDSSDTYPVPWTTNETGVNRWGASEVAQLVAATVTAIDADYLDHYLGVLDTADTDILNAAKDSILAKLVSSSATADPNDYNQQTMSLQAIAEAAALGTGVTTALEADYLDHFLALLDTTDTDILNAAKDSILAKLVSSSATADPNDYNQQTDSLQAIADHIQTLITTAAGSAKYPSGVTDDTIIAMMLSKDDPAAASSYENDTDSLEAIADAIGAVGGQDLRGTTDANTGGTTYFISSELTGFGDNYFNSGWTATVIKDNAAAAPEFEERDITDYRSSNGRFIVSPAFSAQVTTSDEVMLRPYVESDLTRKATMFGGSGNIYYVDAGQAGTPSTPEIGKTWDGSFTTIALAIAGADADNGDVIYVAAGHEETLGAAQLTWNVAGVKIIGLGEGTLVPTIIFGNAASSVDVTAANIYVENMKFLTSVDNVLVGIDIAGTADGFHLKNCVFDYYEATDEFLEAIEFKAADTNDVTIEGCTFYAHSTGAATEAIISEVGVSDNTRIIGNTFIGSWVVSPIWSSFAHTNSLIADNVIQNDKTLQHCIELTAAWTGSCINNTMYGDTIGSILDPGSLYCSGNTGVTAINEAAQVLPRSAVSTDVLEQPNGSDLERLEVLQNKSDDILAGLRSVGGTLGDVFYVDSVSGSSANNGTSWELAEATIKQGYDDAAAGVGDIVFVAAGYAETLANATIEFDTAGVTVIGIGDANEMPIVDCQHGNSQVNVTGANNTVIGLNFHSTTAASTLGFDVDAPGLTLQDCVFTDDGGDFEFAITVDLGATAEDTTIRNCTMTSITGNTGATSAIAITGGVIDSLIIEDCYIWGDFSNANIYSTQANTRALIKGNHLTNNNSGEHVIEITAASTGEIVGNTCVADTIGQVIDPGSMRCFGNKASMAIDTGDQDIQLVPGKTYSLHKQSSSEDDDLFVVAGGPIEILSFQGVVSTQLQAVGSALSITLDATPAPWSVDIAFSTSVECNNDIVGTRYVFTNAAQSIFTPISDGTGCTNLMESWFCGTGTIELVNADASASGGIEWYMTFRPLTTGVQVTVAP